MRVLEGNVVFKYLLTKQEKMQHMTNYKKEMEEK